MQPVHGSATIYQFPMRGRSTNDARPADAHAEALRAELIPCVDFGGGWYHDAAIEDLAPKPAAKIAYDNVSPFVRH